MHSENFLDIFWKFCTFFVFKSYYRTRRLGVVRGSDFLEKNHQICWNSGCDFHLPVKKIFRNLCILEKSGDWIRILWFTGFLAVIFTSQGLLAQGVGWGFFKAQQNLRLVPKDTPPVGGHQAHRRRTVLSCPSSVSMRSMVRSQATCRPSWAPHRLSLIHIWRCRRYAVCRSRWSPYH